jgi:hypothetical protein
MSYALPVRVARFASALLLLSLLSLNCKNETITGDEETDTISPVVAVISPVPNDMCCHTDTIVIAATDAKGVTRVEVYIDGALAASTSSAPWAFIWDTENSADGNHTIYAKAYDAAGNVGQSSSISVSVRNTFTAIFHNYLYTDLLVTVNAQTRTIAPQDSTTYSIKPLPASLTYHAETSGKTSSGTRIGYLLSWDYTTNVSGTTSRIIDPGISSNYFFMYIRNSGGVALGPIYVNYGLSDQSMDNISLPTGGLNYRIGYYPAHSNTQVRAMWSGSASYSYWNQGVNFSLPFTSNQYVVLVNTAGKVFAGDAFAGTGIVGVCRNLAGTGDISNGAIR